MYQFTKGILLYSGEKPGYHPLSSTMGSLSFGPLSAHWDPDITSTVTFTWVNGLLSWTFTHTSSSTDVGEIEIAQNGSVFETYTGAVSGEPFDQSQSGSRGSVFRGDTITAISSAFTWTIPNG